METTKITVYDYSGARFGASKGQIISYLKEEPLEYNVAAYCVGGRDGIQAFWTEGDMLYTADGDDGHWWLTGITHTRWTSETIVALASTL